MIDTDRDTEIFFRAAGNKYATWAGDRIKVIFDTNTYIDRQKVIDVRTGTHTILKPHAAWPGLAGNAVVEVDGVQYQVYEVSQLDDGAVDRVDMNRIR